MRNHILFKDYDKCKPVNLAGVLYIKGAGSYTAFHFKDGSAIEQCGHKGLWDERIKRKADFFLSIDKSTSVNCEQIEAFSRRAGILFKNGKTLPISSSGFLALCWYFEWGASMEEIESASSDWETPSEKKDTSSSGPESPDEEKDAAD